MPDYYTVSSEGQIRNFLNLLATPEGILISILVVAIVFPLVLYFRQLKWTILAMMLFASTLGFTGQESSFHPVLMFPIEQLRYQGRGLTGSLILTLLLSCLGLSREWRTKLISGGALAFFLFQILVSVRMIMSGDISRGVPGGVLFILTFLTMGVLWPRALQNWDHAVAAVRSIVAMGVMFLAANLMQLVYNASAVSAGNRFYGTTGNPQHAAVYIAASLPALCYLIARPGRSKLGRLFLANAVGFLVILLVWTGSRTGFLMLVVGVSLLFRARLGRFVIAAIVCGAFVLMASSILSDTATFTNRIFTTDDTRSEVWGYLLKQFLAHPIFGNPEASWSESSYLVIMARFGLVGMLPFLVALGLVLRSMYQLQRARKYLEDPMLADFVTAGLISLAVGALFEGSITGMLNLYVFLIYIYLALMAFLIDYGAAVRNGVQFMQDDDVVHNDQWALQTV